MFGYRSSSLVVLSSFLCVAAPLVAQENTKGALVLAGHVVNALTNEPIGHALVQIFTPTLERNTLFSDTLGGFRLTNLSEGEYRIQVSRPHFTSESDSTVIQLAASREDVSIAMTPLSSISGKVTNEAGEAMEGVAVQAFASQIEDGRRVLLQERSVATDDRGFYRMWNLLAGRYLLRASGLNSRTVPMFGKRNAALDPKDGFAPVYADGSQDFANAAPLAVGKGEAVLVDFTLPSKPAYQIRGVLDQFDIHQPIEFQLLAPSGQVTTSRTMVNPMSGAFQVEAVVAGSYRLRVLQGQGDERRFAETELQVGDSDVNGLKMRLVPLPSIRGALIKEAFTDSSRTENARPFDSVPYAVQLIPDTPFDSGGVLGFVDENGRLEFRNVLPGSYTLRASFIDGYATRASVGQADLPPDCKLTVRADAVTPEIHIVERNDSGAIEGQLQHEGAVSNSRVLVIPQFVSIRGPILADLFPDGKFELTNLAPGSYTLYSFPATVELEYRNDEFLKGLTGGKHVEVAAGEKVSVTLTEEPQ